MKTGRARVFNIGFSLTVVALLVASCTPGATAPPASPSSAPPPTAKVTEAPVSKAATPAATPKPSVGQPRYGGILNLAIRSELIHYDIHVGSSWAHLAGIACAYNGLVQYDPFKPGELIPDLAEKWTVSSDGLTYTFDLRKGVKWHDGKPLTSADVALTLERLRKHVHVGPGLEPMKSLETPDEYTVKVLLEYPSAGLLNYIAMSWGAILPKHIIDAKGHMKDDVVGTGAFKLKRHDRGVSIELAKNNAYFVPERPYLDGVRTYFIGDEASSMAGLRTARIDYMPLVGDSRAMRLKETFLDGNVDRCRGGQFRAIYLPVDKAPWNDVRIRKAVHLAIDRQAAIKIIMEGVGELGSHIPDSMGGITEEELLKRPGYRQPKDADIAEAKKLLAEAGFPSGFKTSTLHRKGMEYEIAAVFMSEQLAKIGIDVALKTMDDAAYYEIRGKRGFETFCTRHSLSTNDADLVLKKWYKSGVTENWSNFSDAELDRLIDLQSREQDKEKRKAIVRQANERLEELLPVVMLSWSGYWKAWGPRVKNFVMPAQHYDDQKFADVWVTG